MDYQTSKVLAVSNLSYNYGKQLVWEQVNFSLNPGDVCLLVGQNGSGKSTLMRCLAGLDTPASGTIHVSGKLLVGTARDLRAELSFVSDTPPFYADMTAEEHIDFVLKANRRVNDHECAHWLATAFGLHEHLQRYPSTYSRGMRHKLAVVIALMVKPRLLLLDEAFAFLDQKTALLLSNQLASFAQEGASILLSCHQRIPLSCANRALQISEKSIKLINKDALEGLFNLNEQEHFGAPASID